MYGGYISLPRYLFRFTGRVFSSSNEGTLSAVFDLTCLSQEVVSMDLIKSPQYTGGEFMFLNRFIRRPAPPPPPPAADSCSHDNLNNFFFNFLHFGTTIGPDQ